MFLKSLSTIIAGLLLCSVTIATPALAADYSGYSNEELNAMRGTMRNASPEERAAFQQEWQNRLRNMTPAELKRYRGRPANAPADGKGYRLNAPGSGYGMNQGMGSGSGSGMGMRHGHGRGKFGGRGR